MTPEEKAEREAIKLFAQALLSGTHSPAAIAAEFCTGPDDPIDLRGKSPAELENLLGSKVIPAPGVAEYLASGDLITDKILDAAEIATEKYHGIQPPYYIYSHRSGKEGKGLKADYFCLQREE